MISSHRVSSWFECSEKCLENEDCNAFSYRISSSNDINCKIASDSSEVVTHSLHNIDEWTTYERRDTQPVSSRLKYSQTQFLDTEHNCGAV